MLEIASATHLLQVGGPGDDAWLDAMPSLARVDVDAAEGTIPAPGGALEHAPLPVIEPDDAAYVFFTSGSTGTPKGVLGCHKGLSHFLTWQRDTFGVGPGDRTAQLTGLSFDVVLRDVFLPLVSGATLVLPDEDAPPPDRLFTWMDCEAITLLHTVPALARAWLADVPAGVSLRSLRWVFFAGEPLTDTLVASWRRTFPAAGAIVNLYGPTETTLAKFFFRVPGEPLPGVQPIGAPLPQTQGLVLSPAGRLAGVGEVGEIVIRTPFRSLGYLDLPAENEARFIKNPFRDEDGDRVYRTGDRGRYRPDGALEIQGRLDWQIKIRGVRVEPGEVEAALGRHPAVKHAVVAIVSGEPSDDPRLVAYVVARSSPAPAAAELRAHLQALLLAAMVPAAFVLLDAIPLLANGKVDHRALPAPERATAGEDLAPPRDALEAGIAALFCEVLGLRTVSVRDSFFDLGGHSMLAVRLVRAIERRFHRSLALVSLFEAQTVEQIAALLRTPGHQHRQFTLVPIRSAGVKRPLFLVARPNDNALGYVALGRHLDPHRPAYLLQHTYPEESELGRPYTPEEYQEWAASYVEAIRLVQPDGPYVIAGMCEGAIIAFTMTRVLEAAGERVAFLAMLDAWPLENTTRPLARRVFIYEKRLRAIAALSFREQLLTVSRMIERRVHRLLHPPEGSGAVDPWDARLYPGRDFVPPRVSAPITVLRVKKQPYWRIHDERLGWGDRTTGGVEVHDVPGDHSSILREPHVVEIARVLDARIDGADPLPQAPAARRSARARSSEAE